MSSSSTWTGTSIANSLRPWAKRTSPAIHWAGPATPGTSCSFPIPTQFLTRLHADGLKTSLNLHPASGVQPWEEAYPAMAKAMGIDPATKKYVPFDITDKKFATNYMNLLHHPLEKQGIDFWWLDWQQEPDHQDGRREPDLVAQLRPLHRPAARRQAAAALPPLGRARQSPLPDRLLRRHRLRVGLARLPAVVHGHRGQRRLRLLEPRHRRPHARRRRSRALHALGAVRRLQPDPAHPHHQESRLGAPHLGLSRAVLVDPALGLPASLCAAALHLHRGAPHLRHRRRLPAPALLRLARSQRSLHQQGRVPLRRSDAGRARRRARRQDSAAWPPSMSGCPRASGSSGRRANTSPAPPASIAASPSTRRRCISRPARSFPCSRPCSTPAKSPSTRSS